MSLIQKAIMISVLIVMALYIAIAPSHACRYIREEMTPRQEFDAAKVVIAAKLSDKVIETISSGDTAHHYTFDVIEHYKVEVPDIWYVGTSNSSCGFFHETGSYFIFHLNENEWLQGFIKETTRYRRFDDEDSFRKALYLYKQDVGLGLPR